MGTPFSSGVGEISSSKDIEALTGPQLVQLHNELVKSETPVKKFASREKGVQRTALAFAAWQSLQKAGGKSDDGSIRTYRPDSNRGKVIELASVSGGAAWAALRKATGWDDKALAAAVHRIKGYTGLTVAITGEGDERNVCIEGTLKTRKPFAFDPKGEIKLHKPNTKRDQVLQLLLSDRGATFAEIQDATQWDDRTAYEGIRLIHGYLGYGIKEDDNGKIHAFIGKAKMAAPKPKKEKAPPKEKKTVAKKATKKSTKKKTAVTADATPAEEPAPVGA